MTGKKQTGAGAGQALHLVRDIPALIEGCQSSIDLLPEPVIVFRVVRNQFLNYLTRSLTGLRGDSVESGF
jgi:hypothetical protein